MGRPGQPYAKRSGPRPADAARTTPYTGAVPDPQTLTDATEKQAAGLILQHDEHVALNTGLITVDYWELGQAEHERHTANSDEQRFAAWYRGHDPQRQLQLLEHTRLLNPENEDIYRDIIRVQAELGLTGAISRTIQLLTRTLADIGERPDPSTFALARALQARHHRAASY